MGREADTDIDDDDELLLDDEVEDEQEEDVEDDDDPDADAGDEEEEDEDGEQFVGFVGEDDEPDEPASDNSTIRQMRQQIKDLKRQVAEGRGGQDDAEIDPGPRPTLEDVDYDEDKLVEAIDAWQEKRRNAKQVKARREEQNRTAQEAWQRDLTGYEAKKAQHGFADFEDAEDAVKATLSLAQQATIVKAASDPALFVYAVGRHGGKLSELAKIEDPIKLAAMVARMEGGIKMKKRKSAPSIDKPAKGGRTPPGTKDRKLERLEKQADKTGDRTALIQYKRKMKEQGK